ncbi:hypothetical protein [Methanococcoides sp. NM1]|nr:hypothetical protein [Methanococcoides sp. NM1]
MLFIIALNSAVTSLASVDLNIKEKLSFLTKYPDNIDPYNSDKG